MIVVPLSPVNTDTSVPKHGTRSMRQVDMPLQLTAENQGSVDQLIRGQRMATAGKLAAGGVHDMRTFLGHLMEMSRRTLKSIGEGDLNGAREHLHHFDSLLNNLLSITGRLHDFATTSLNCVRPVSVSRVVAETMDLLRHCIPCSVELVALGADQDFNVLGDSVQLQQVLVNLILNAQRAFMECPLKKQKDIVVTLSEADPVRDARYLCAARWKSNLLVSVEDNAGGMSAETMSRIGQPLFTTRNGGEGSGLGLFMTNYLVVAHGGSLIVESELGVGSNFTVCLPLHSRGPLNLG